MLETVLYSLRLFVVGGDGSGGAHLYTKCHGCIYTTLSTTSCRIMHCLRLFVLP